MAYLKLFYLTQPLKDHYIVKNKNLLNKSLPFKYGEKSKLSLATNRKTSNKSGRLFEIEKNHKVLKGKLCHLRL